MTSTAEPRSRQMDMIVECDQCHMTYQPDLVTVPTSDGGEYKSFTCPHCKTEYPVCTITARGLELRDEVQHLREAVRSGRHDFVQRLGRAVRLFERECRKGENPAAMKVLEDAPRLNLATQTIEPAPQPRKRLPGECACGKRISMNKSQCLACADAQVHSV